MAQLAVLLTTYNRPDLTSQVLEKIALYKPRRLYVASDGPRPDKPEDYEKVRAVRSLLLEPGWDVELHHRFLDTNLGSGEAVRGAIDWFFDSEEEGVILEDDCVPSLDFFRLAEHIMERYRENPRVWGVTGSNTARLSFPASYGFIGSPLTWGWATWKTRWQRHDPTMADYLADNRASDVKWWPTEFHRIAFSRHLRSIAQSGLPDAWDYQWAYTVMKNDGLWAVPSTNLVRNIGFGVDATNTHPKRFEEQPFEGLGIINDPPATEIDASADLEVLRKIHNVVTPLWLNYPLNALRLLRNELRRIRERVIRGELPGWAGCRCTG